MTFSPVNVSNNVLKRAFDDGVEVSPMKLQKLLYFIASEYAKDTGQTLLHESFRAWRYGPVIRSVYDEFRAFGGAPIRAFAKDAEGKAYRISERKNPNLERAITRVWRRGKFLSAVELSRITHYPDSAWDKATSQKSEFLKNDDIKSDETYAAELGL